MLACKLHSGCSRRIWGGETRRQSREKLLELINLLEINRFEQSHSKVFGDTLPGVGLVMDCITDMEPTSHMLVVVKPSTSNAIYKYCATYINI